MFEIIGYILAFIVIAFITLWVVEGDILEALFLLGTTAFIAFELYWWIPVWIVAIIVFAKWIDNA